MASLEEKLQVITDHLNTAQNVVVVMAADASRDKVAVALAWSDVVKAMGKSVTLITPQLPTMEFDSTMPIQTEMGFRDLEVVFPYQAEAVEKVSYNIDEEQQRFHLLIKPHKGHPPLSADQVEFRYVGAEADLVILVGIHDFEQLQYLYEGYEQLFDSSPSLTFHTFEPEIGLMHLEVSGGTSFSQYFTQLMIQCGWSITPGTASDLLRAIEEESQFFQSLTTTPETFDTVAYLMRLGARRQKRQVAASVTPVVIPATTTTTVADFASALGKPPVEAGKSKRKKKATVSSEEEDQGSLNYQPNQVAPGGRG